MNHSNIYPGLYLARYITTTNATTRKETLKAEGRQGIPFSSSLFTIRHVWLSYIYAAQDGRGAHSAAMAITPIGVYKVR